jgi:hypothetical protein
MKNRVGLNSMKKNNLLRAFVLSSLSAVSNISYAMVIEKLAYVLPFFNRQLSFAWSSL